jgi:hypothetical protein
VWGIALVEGFKIEAIIIACFILAIVMSGVLKVVQVSSGPTIHVAVGIFVTVCSLLLFGLYRHTMLRQNKLWVTRRLEQTSSELESTELSRWLQIIIKSTRNGYSIWSSSLSFVIPWLGESRSPIIKRCASSPEPYTESESAFRQDSPGNSNRSSGTQRARPNSSSLEQDGSGSSGQGNLHDFDFGFNANGTQQEDDDSNDGHDDSNSDDEGDDGDDVDHEEAAHLFLHLIVPSSLGTKKQIPIKVTGMTTDYDLFLEIIRVYRDHCGSFHALFMVDSLRPTKYELFNRTNVRTFDPSDQAETMPNIVHPPPEYTFSYLPVEPYPDPPLLHPAQLTTLFYDPNSSRHFDFNGTTYDAQVYSRAPKRKGILRYTVNQGYPIGYGFEFKERFNTKFVIKCEIFITLLALLLGGLYWGFATKDEQRTGTAANIGMLVIAVGQVVYMLVLGLTEWLEAWRY